MVVNVTARHFKAWPELQEAAKDAALGFKKLNEFITRTDIVLGEEHGKFVEFTVHVNDHIFNAKETSEDFDKSIHGASDKIMAQLRKLKEKNGNHRP